MNPDLPAWLDNAFLEAALQGAGREQPQVKVVNFSAERAVPLGINFTSGILRVKIEYAIGAEKKSSSLILKTLVAVFQTLDLFNKEPDMYNRVIPEVSKLTNCDIGPASFYSSVKTTLVLEDLKVKGFSLCDRYKQLDFPHCELVVKKLAKFHAGSIVCKINDPELIDKVGQEIMFNDNSQTQQMIPLLLGGLKVVSGICEQMGMSKDVEDMFNKCSETAAESMVRLCKPRATGLNVLNHGDLWTCNVLFKHDDSGKVADLRLIDFQACKYSSPVMDLVYFIWTSANEDVRELNLPELCEIYRKTLNSSLEQLGCKERLTTEELHEQFRDAKDFALMTICSTLPVQMCAPEAHEAMNIDDPSMKFEDFQNSQSNFLMKVFEGTQYKSLLPKLVKHIQNWINYYN